MARAWLIPIQSQADAAAKINTLVTSVTSIGGSTATPSAEVGVFNPDPNYGLTGVTPLTLA